MGWAVLSEPDFGKPVFSEVLFTLQPSARACRPYLPKPSTALPNSWADLVPLREAGGTADPPYKRTGFCFHLRNNTQTWTGDRQS